MRVGLVVIALGLSGCQCGSTAPAVLGEACGPTRGCDEGLTCKAGVCAAVDGTGGGQAAGGGTAATGGGTAATGGGSAATGGGTAASGGGSGGGTGGGTTATGGGTGVGGGDACGGCNSPPSACHEQQGTCQAGHCVYNIVMGASCDDGNACTIDDSCTANGCVGTPKICSSPPSAVCVSATDLRTYDAMGVCQGGLCVYNRNTVTCGSGGCVNNACQTNPCANVTCNMPPSICYAPTGTCSGGSCSYGYADGTSCDDQNACTVSDSCNTGVCRGVPKACNMPPADVCENATTLRAYNPVGSCSAGTGACSYTYNFVTCSAGCANARCNSSGWQSMVSNSTQELHAVWGTSAASVWVGGALGTMLYFNGTTWQVRSSGTQLQIVSIHGTSATNVFAGTVGGDVLFNDGTGWTKIASLGNNYLGFDYVTGVAAVGPKDVFVWGHNSYDGQLFRVTWSAATNSWATTLGVAVQDGTAGLISVGIAAYDPNDVVLGGGYLRHWDGGTIGQVPNATGGTRLYATPAHEVFTLPSYGSNAQRGPLDGGAWSVLNTGYAGDLTGINGTSPNHLYISGRHRNQSGPGTGAVLFYDGQGISQESLPAGIVDLYDVWEAPTGEVFAVGASGTIIRGP